MTDQEPAQPQDTTRDWAGEEAEALRIERERVEKLQKEQHERE